ncbi:MAG: hypothetical protein L0Y58_13375 [Verrucomicrobia subdivision 3 bacterium]|nr:hypothetical protein [Limisphaerales bacterium]
METSFASPPRRISPEGCERPRFTVDGSDELEAFLAESCEGVRSAVMAALPPNSIEGLLLAGGYGRGEGGVASSESDRPYNDLEFYLFVRNNPLIYEHRHRTALANVTHGLSEAIGIEVEIKIISLAKLRRAPVSIFFYDMIAGHKWLIGDDELLRGCAHHRAAHLIPLSEATRLLMNRCSGLLFAREQFGAAPFLPKNADFIRRNIAKAQLSFGDAILAAYGRYHWSCRERHERLRKFDFALPWRSELLEHHRRGVAFKLHPWRSAESHDQLARDLDSATCFAGKLWLWWESTRLHHSFISARHYCTSAVRKWPDSNRWRNLLLNLKAFRRPVLTFRHPREPVLEALSILLWEPVALTDPTLRQALVCRLRYQSNDFSSAVAAYRRLWAAVN